MPEKGNALSRNPNICASCSSMADGMEEYSLPENPSLAPQRPQAVASHQSEESAPEGTIHHFPT
jgi:hypothetical protein